MNLKAKIYIYVNSTIQRCSKKIIKIFLIEDFFHLPPVSATPVVNLELRISPRLLNKFEMVLMGYSGAGGKLIHKKTRSKKSRDTVPFSSMCTQQYSYPEPPPPHPPAFGLMLLLVSQSIPWIEPRTAVRVLLTLRAARLDRSQTLSISTVHI